MLSYNRPPLEPHHGSCASYQWCRVSSACRQAHGVNHIMSTEHRGRDVYATYIKCSIIRYINGVQRPWAWTPPALYWSMCRFLTPSVLAVYAIDLFRQTYWKNFFLKNWFQNSGGAGNANPTRKWVFHISNKIRGSVWSSGHRLMCYLQLLKVML